MIISDADPGGGGVIYLYTFNALTAAVRDLTKCRDKLDQAQFERLARNESTSPEIGKARDIVNEAIREIRKMAIDDHGEGE